MPVVTFLNQKGGVGKTSTTFHLAGSLARSGRSVLIVDNDPQASLTQGIYGSEATERIPPTETILQIYEGRGPLAQSIIRPTKYARIDVIPGCSLNSRWNKPEPWDQPANIQLRFKDMMDQVRSKYSVVLVDCPPNLHLCSWAALLGSEGVVIPLQAEDYGAQGISAVIEAIDKSRALSPVLSLLGLVITMFDRRTAIARMHEEELRKRFGQKVFDTNIPRLVDFAEAINARKPVSLYRPNGVASERMDAFAVEFMARLNQLPQPKPRRKAVTS